MGGKKNLPAIATAKGKPCPVCGQTSYSRDGIHPQCSFFRSDEELLELRRQDRANAAVPKEKP